MSKLLFLWPWLKSLTHGYLLFYMHLLFKYRENYWAIYDTVYLL